MKNQAIHKSKLGKRNWQGLVYALVPLLGFAFFNLAPAAISFFVSFGEMTGFNLSDWHFTGLNNYIKALTEKDGFWHALGISAYSTLAQFISLAVAIVIAACINRKLKGSKVFSVIYFIPYICSSVAVAFMWQRMFQPTGGVVNSVLEWIMGEDYASKLYAIFDPERVDATLYNWYDTAVTFMPMLILVISWQAAGYGIVVVGAALTSVDKSLYESARVDGASRLRQFFSITLPQISPTIYFLLTLGIVNGLQTFDIAMIFVGTNWSGYGPDNMGQTLMLYIYKQNELNMPYASAMSWLLFIILIVLQKINARLSRRWVHED